MKTKSEQRFDEAYATRMEIIRSPDDGGWYWQRWSDGATSQIFPTEGDARQAKAESRLVWDA
jgi:hypothetical protein